MKYIRNICKNAPINTPKKRNHGGQAGVGGWYGIPRDYRPFKCYSRGCIMMGKDDSSKKSGHK